MRGLESGFLYARHDVPGELIDEAYSMLASFFALDRDVKQRQVVEGARGQSGYVGTLVETAADSDTPDWKEMLNWGAELPAAHPLRQRFPHRYSARAFPEAELPGITEVLGRFHDRLLDLQRRFLRIIAVGLGCHEGYFEEMVKDGPTLTRAIRYPPMEQSPGAGHVWAAAHGDINLITALPRATAAGLQIQTKNGWVDAVAPDGHAIINTGLMLERLTNGRIPVGIHRVVAGEGQVGERYSVVQFCHPTPWTVLAPILAGDAPRFAPIAAGDWLDQVLYDINLSELAGDSE